MCFWRDFDSRGRLNSNYFQWCLRFSAVVIWRRLLNELLHVKFKFKILLHFYINYFSLLVMFLFRSGRLLYPWRGVFGDRLLLSEDLLFFWYYFWHPSLAWYWQLSLINFNSGIVLWLSFAPLGFVIINVWETLVVVCNFGRLLRNLYFFGLREHQGESFSILVLRCGYTLRVRMLKLSELIFKVAPINIALIF